jgi:hypothetical protein
MSGKPALHKHATGRLQWCVAHMEQKKERLRPRGWASICWWLIAEDIEVLDGEFGPGGEESSRGSLPCLRVAFICKR